MVNGGGGNTRGRSDDTRTDAEIAAAKRSGMIYVYLIEIAIGGVLVVVYYFVALRGFRDVSDNNIAVAGMSAGYLLVAALVEALILHPILVRALVRASRHMQGDDSEANVGRLVYWAFVLIVYHYVLKNYLISKRKAKAAK